MTRLKLFLNILIFVTSAVGQLTLNPSFSAGVTEGGSNGLVSAVQADGKVLVGGGFQYAGGVQRPALVRLSLDGSPDPSFNPPSNMLGAVYAIRVLSDGKIIVGGQITRGILRLNPDGTLDDTFNVGGTGVGTASPVGGVQSITIQADGKYLISGGEISSYNGVPKFSVVRVNSDGSLDETFTSPFTTTTPFVEQTAVQADGKIIIGGEYTLGSYADFARLNIDGTLDTSFGSGSVSTNGSVFAVSVDADNKILIGGGFGMVNGVTRTGSARLNADGSLDTTFNPQIPFTVEYFALRPNGKIVLSGAIGGSPNGLLQPVVQYNSDGTLDSSFTPPLSNHVGYHVALQPDGKVLLTGFFSDIGTPGLGHQNFVRLNSDGALDTAFNSPALSGGSDVAAIIEQTDGKIVAAGNFYRGNGSPHRGLVRFNGDGAIDETFQSGWGAEFFFSNPRSILITQQPDGKLLLGSAFAFGQTYNLSFFEMGLLRVNANGSPDTSFHPSGITNIGSRGIHDLLVQPDGKIVVASSSLSTFPLLKIVVARLNSDGTLDSTFAAGTVANSPPPGFPNDIVRQPDGKLIVVGTFVNYKGISRNRIVRVNTDGTVDTTFNPGTGANGEISLAALQPDGKIIIYGGFSSYNGTPRSGLARVNADGSLDETFNPGSGVNGPVTSIAVQPDGKTVIAGMFSTYNGTSTIRLARINSDGSLDTTAPSGISTQGFLSNVLSTSDGQLLIGGIFSSYGGVPRNNIAKLRIDDPAGTSFDYDGDGRTDFSVFRPSSGAWYLQRSTAGFQGLQFGASGDKLTPADYDGDGKTDIAIYRPATGIWYILNSSNGTVSYPVFGVAEDLPTPGDYDGDGKADITVFRPSQGTWYRTNSSNGTTFGMQFGANGDVPTVGDFDGDGKNDLGIFRPSIGDWYNIRSSNGSVFGERFGQTGDRIAPADYDGDGKTDIAIYRPSTGLWVVRNSATATYSYDVFGAPADIPIAGDYDGDGKADIGVWRPSDGTWYIKRSDNSQFIVFPWGQNGDKPTPAAYGN